MSAHRPSPLSVAGERGIALMTTILMMVLMSALLVGFTTAVMSDQSYRTIDRDRARAFYGAQSGIEKQNADLARLFINQVGPTDAQVIALGATTHRPTIPNVSFVTTGASPAYAVTPVTGGATYGIIQSGAYEGLMALKRQIQLDATARAIDGGEVHLRRVVEAVAIPVFQFGIFSDVDLAFNAADDFNFGGRVHTNGNLFLAEGSGSTLTLRDKVSAYKEIIRTHLTNGVTVASAGHTGTVNMTRGNGSGPFRHMTTSEGSLTGNLGSSQNSSWNTVSLSTYVGNIRNGRTGVKALNLDLVAANGANIDLIRRPASTEALTSAIFAERYFKKVSVRILLSDKAIDITSLPTVSSTPPVLLDGNWAVAGSAPTGYLYNNAGRPAIARSGGPVPNSPAGASTAQVNAAVTANASTTITVKLAGGFPDYFKVPANMEIRGALTNLAIVTGVTCTGNKTRTQIFSCTRNALPGNIAAVIPNGSLLVATSRAVDGRVLAGIPMNMDGGTTWAHGATKSFTAVAANTTYPLLPLSINTFFIRDKNILVTCAGYTLAASPTRSTFTECNVPANIAADDVIETSYLSNAGIGTIGGYLKVEIQTSDNNWTDVTTEWLNYGIAGENLGGRKCYINDNSAAGSNTAIIRLQRYRDNNEPDRGSGALDNCTYSGSTASGDFWPNVLFDVREALSRDDEPASHNGRVMLGGSMHYVELDATNLSRWFARTGAYAAGTGNQAMREGGSPTAGFSVYFSDRRNNRNQSNLETGDYGWEDTINPGNATGAPDGVLNSGEDVNANATLDVYGQYPNYDGNSSSAPPGAAAPMNTSARPLTFLSAGQARVNRQIIFRRALKIVNGSLGNLISPGLTIAAENPVYLQGDWNASTTAGWTGASVATSIAADTVVALSNAWNDLNSFSSPYAIGGRPRSSETYYRVALISGKGTIFPAGTVGGTYGTDGGAHNFIRFIEGNNGTNLVHYQGSMVTFYYTRQNLMPHKCCSNIIYGVPDRDYIFDQNFLNPSLLPPLTPAFRDINALGFAQETRPGK